MYESVNRENSVKIGSKRACEHIGIDGSKVYRITFTKTFPVAKIIHLRVDNIVALYYILKREGGGRGGGGTNNKILAGLVKEVRDYILVNRTMITVDCLLVALNLEADQQSKLSWTQANGN